jgi:hypothetical protein
MQNVASALNSSMIGETTISVNSFNAFGSETRSVSSRSVSPNNNSSQLLCAVCQVSLNMIFDQSAANPVKNRVKKPGFYPGFAALCILLLFSGYLKWTPLRNSRL